MGDSVSFLEEVEIGEDPEFFSFFFFVGLPKNILFIYLFLLDQSLFIFHLFLLVGG